MQQPREINRSSPMKTPCLVHARLLAAALALAGPAALVAGCGGEVAGTSAAVGKLQAEQAQQAKAQQDRLVQQLKAAQDAGAARAASAAE